MDQLKIFTELSRINKPIGYMLLFWPCAWGLLIGYDFKNENNIFYFYLILFFLGSVLMRSAGCIINDIADKNYDIRVERTKKRPIASGEVTVLTGYLIAGILCLLSFFILINFNKFTILLALA